ncbi:MAG: hypothetical protein PHU75_03420 [Candidatus Nanopelagicales bacterium]|nr:hypothetical protein [Candidatus Nanopelagicales bacterium]
MRAWRAGRRVAVALAVAGLIATSGAASAQADEQAVKYACASRPLTWSVQILGAPSLSVAKERTSIASALKQVTEATRGDYAFTYAPTTPVSIAWGTSEIPATEPYFPPYATTPAVDLLFLILPDRAIAPGLPVGFTFPAGPAHYSSKFATYYSPSADDTFRASGHTNLLFSSAAMARATPCYRARYYLWGGVNGAGVRDRSLPQRLSAGTIATLRAAVQQSCDLVARYPDAVLTNP